MRYKKFKREALHNQCRKCINRFYGIELTPKDCRYWFYPGECMTCGQIGHLVTDIVPFSRRKIWRAKKIDRT